MTPEEHAKGGEWRIGDSEKLFPLGHPGRSQVAGKVIGSNPRPVQYKSWVADHLSGKYEPGAYKFINRVEKGEEEFVHVMDGCLTLLWKEKLESQPTRQDLVFEQPVHIPAFSLRSWELPASEDETRGVTILSSVRFHCQHEMWQTAEDCGFTFDLWGSKLFGQKLNKPVTEKIKLPKQFVEVFKGFIPFRIGTNTYRLNQGEFLYRAIMDGPDIEFLRPPTEARGIVMYYQ